MLQKLPVWNSDVVNRWFLPEIARAILKLKISQSEEPPHRFGLSLRQGNSRLNQPTEYYPRVNLKAGSRIKSSGRNYGDRSYITGTCYYFGGLS